MKALALALCLGLCATNADPRYFHTAGPATDVPYGYAEIFCQNYPRECLPSPRSEPLKSADWKETIVRINREVNHRLQAAEWAGTRSSPWRINASPADCAVYAITKRDELIKAGVPRSALRLAMVKFADDDWHLVLVVSTDDGDRILDNLRDLITTPDKAGYDWSSIQDTRMPRRWLSVADESPTS